MKNKNWRIVPIMLAVVMAVSFVGCGKGKSDDVPTAGDYSYQNAGQYTFEGIPEDQTVTDENESDTDSTGRVYGNNGSGSSYKKGSSGGSYGGLGSANEYVPGNGGNNGGNSGNYYPVGGNNSTTKMSTSSILNLVKGVAKTYDEAIKMLESMGIPVDAVIKGALKKYYDSLTKPTKYSPEDISNGVSNIIGGIGDIIGRPENPTIPEE